MEGWGILPTQAPTDVHAILNKVCKFIVETCHNNYNAGVHFSHTGRKCFILCRCHCFYTGDAMLERISSQVIVLDPPEKLVIETRASGGYQQLDWMKNGNPFTTAQGQPFTVTLQEFPNFFEIFVREPTTTNDLGVYEVELLLNTGLSTPEVDLTVTPYSKYMYRYDLIEYVYPLSMFGSTLQVIHIATHHLHQVDYRPSGQSVFTSPKIYNL